MQLMCVVFLLDIALVSFTDGSCREGWYGVDCGLQCSDACRPLEIYPCDKETGKCSQGCKLGFYGPQCEKNCSCFGHCIQDTGDCIGDPSTSINVPSTQATPPAEQRVRTNNTSDTDEPKQWMIVAVVFILLFAILMVSFVSYCFYVRRMSQRAQQPVSGIEIPSVREPLLETDNGLKQNETIEEHNTTIKNLGLCQDSSYHLLKEKKLIRSAFLQCTWLTLDPEKINITAANLDVYGKLSNKPDNSPCQTGERFKNYSGTTTTVPLFATGSAQYWEVKSNIAFEDQIPENETLLDFGFCIDEDRDLERFTLNRSFRVENCSTHKRICLKAFSDRKSTCYQPLVIKSHNGSTLTLNLGFLLHESWERITCFDFENLTPFHTVSIEFKDSFWPMFGLGAQSSATTNMTLVCGNDISMDDDKILMIKNQLWPSSKT